MRMMRLLMPLPLLLALVTAASADRPQPLKRKGKGAVIQFTGGTKQALTELLKAVPGVIRAEPTFRAPDAEDLLFVEYDPNRVSFYQLTTLAGGKGMVLTRSAMG